MEEELKINLKDGKSLFGILRKSKDDTKLVIFVHGLTGHKNEHQFFNAAPLFADEGYTSFRLDLYSFHEDARELLDCTVDTHSEDLDDVIEHYKDKYDEIYLVGHSIGGPTIIFASHENVKAMALWDPSFGIYENLEMYAVKVNGKDEYLLQWGTDFLVSPEFIESLKKVNGAQIPRIDVPSTIILAGEGELEERWKCCYDDIPAEKKLVVIDGADHGFNNPDHEKELFEATLVWFNKQP